LKDTSSYAIFNEQAKIDNTALPIHYVKILMFLGSVSLPLPPIPDRGFPPTMILTLGKLLIRFRPPGKAWRPETKRNWLDFAGD